MDTYKYALPERMIYFTQRLSKLDTAYNEASNPITLAIDVSLFQ